MRTLKEIPIMYGIKPRSVFVASPDGQTAADLVVTVCRRGRSWAVEISASYYLGRERSVQLLRYPTRENLETVWRFFSILVELPEISPEIISETMAVAKGRTGSKRIADLIGPEKLLAALDPEVNPFRPDNGKVFGKLI